MKISEDTQPDEAQMLRYVLGLLPEVEAESLDLLSVTDDELAARLSAVEHDLVDAYVRGELQGDTLDRFETWYLSSPRRMQKVAFARTLSSLENRRRFSGTARRIPPWALLAATLAIFLTSGYLIIDNLRTRPDTVAAGSEAQTVQRQQPVESSSSTQSAGGELPPPPPSLSPPPAQPRRSGETPVVAIAVLLTPQTRSEGLIASIPVQSGVREVSARLQLEFDDFPDYEVALKDPATDRVLWKSESLQAESAGNRRAVPVRLPSALLSSQNYSLELSGTRPDADPEFIGNYVFRAVLE